MRTNELQECNSTAMDAKLTLFLKPALNVSELQLRSSLYWGDAYAKELC